MAVRLEGSIKRFIGLSTDEKPVLGTSQLDDRGHEVEITARDLPPGSSFMESDTGRVLRWTGELWAFPATNGDEQGQWLALLYEEMHSLRELVELVVRDD